MKFLTCAVAGGLIVFVWGMISWMLLPWHEKTLNGLLNESQVAGALATSAPQKGVYILPCGRPKDRNLTDDEQRQIMARAQQQMVHGPFAIIVMSPMGTGSMPLLMARGLAIQIAGAVLLTYLLTLAKLERFTSRIVFASVFSLAAGVITSLPAWNWWGFPAGYTILEMMDLVVGWSLAGLVLAKMTATPSASP